MAKVFIICACSTDPKGRKLSDGGVTAAQRMKVDIGDGASVDPTTITLMSAAAGSPTLTARLLGTALNVQPRFERWLNADTPGGQQLTHWQQTLGGALKHQGKTLVVVAEADTVSMLLSATAGVTLSVAVQPGAVFSYHPTRQVLQQDLPIVYRIHSGAGEPVRA